MEEIKFIGKVIGLGVEPGTFEVLTADALNTRLGEYLIFYDNQNRTVLGIIFERRIQKNLPVHFMASQSLSAKDLAASLGIDEMAAQVEYSLAVRILGYFDEETANLVNPRLTPTPDTPVYLAPTELLKKTLFLKRLGEVASLHVGASLLRPEIPVVLDANKLVSTHFAILAATGAGKSFLARVVLEELLRPQNQMALLVLDPHGEYESLAQLGGIASFKQGDYQPKVKTMKPGEDLVIHFGDLSLGDIRFLLQDLTEKMANELQNLYRECSHDADRAKRQLRYSDLRSAVERACEGEEKGEGTRRSTLEALRWRLDSRFRQSADRISVFDDNKGLSLSEIFSPGQCTVISLEGMEEREQQVVAAILLKKAYESRLKTMRGHQFADSKNELNFPVFFLVEEAHRFAPAGDSEAISGKQLRVVLSEGRKFGVGVGLITQRPGKLDQNVLSQCMSQFLMRIINPIDQDSVLRGVESAGRDLLRELPSLTQGQAVVCGVAVRVPVLVQIKKPSSEHRGKSIEAAQECIKYNSPEIKKEMASRRAGFESPDFLSVYEEE